MAVQRGLGKGLGALLGEASMQTEPQEQPRTLPIQKIEPNPDQPRHTFEENALNELAESIRIHGVLQPLTVRKLENGYYQIIAGERRWRAARLAGLDEIPVSIIEADDKTAAELALIENLQRSDLNPVEEAEGYRRLMSDYKMTQEQAAERVGKSRPAVANALRLLNLPEVLLSKVENGELSAGHARALLALKDENLQLAAAQRVLNLQLSVRQTEELCKKMAKPARPPKPKPEVDYVAECEKTLKRSLGRGVKILAGKNKGRIELEYYSPEDLQTLYEALQTLGRKEQN